jgi:hypothetical protein
VACHGARPSSACVGWRDLQLPPAAVRRYGEEAGGVAYVGSFSWAVDTPAFVFSQKLGSNYAPYIWEAASHECGHTRECTSLLLQGPAPAAAAAPGVAGGPGHRQRACCCRGLPPWRQGSDQRGEWH